MPFRVQRNKGIYTPQGGTKKSALHSGHKVTV
jgi:hypothetical protein